MKKRKTKTSDQESIENPTTNFTTTRLHHHNQSENTTSIILLTIIQKKTYNAELKKVGYTPHSSLCCNIEESS